MKKWIVIGFIGFLAVFIIVKQLNHNDFSASKQLAESGKYEEFYASIQNEIENGNSDAKEILVEYFFKAIDDEDLAANLGKQGFFCLQFGNQHITSSPLQRFCRS